MLTITYHIGNLHHTVPYFLLSLYIYCSYFSTPFTCHSPCQLTNFKFFMIFITNVIFFTYNKDMKEMIIFLKNNITELQHRRIGKEAFIKKKIILLRSGLYV